ncbi:MAG: U32 family peptidase, partial [Vampirovibrionia bacterium]
IRLTRMDQFAALEEYIKNTNNNIVDIIEFGDIIYPSDLAKESYEQIVKRVKVFCESYNIKLYLTTPRILIERDFERVADTVKYLCFKNPRPEGVVINNLGLWKTVSNNKKIKEINIELGYGLNILNSKTVEFFESTCPVSGLNIDSDLSIENIEQIISNTNIPTRSFMILGTSKLHTSGLCPLNNDIAIVSRLSCKAPCQRTSYAIVDPFTNNMLPMVLDGFCRFHLVNSYIEDHLNNIDKYIEAGITDFTIDYSALPGEMIKPLLDRYCSAFNDAENYAPIEQDIIKYEPKVYSK